jgi:hypothetical protein
MPTSACHHSSLKYNLEAIEAGGLAKSAVIHKGQFTAGAGQFVNGCPHATRGIRGLLELIGAANH